MKSFRRVLIGCCTITSSFLAVNCGDDDSGADGAAGAGAGARAGGTAGASSGASGRAGAAPGGRSGAGGVVGGAGTGAAGASGSGGATAGHGNAASGGVVAAAGNGGAWAGGAAGESGAGGSAGDGGEGNGPSGPWASCPSAADYSGDGAWPHVLEVTEGAIYCATFSEARTLKEELAQKALLRIAPGSYPLPGANRAGLGLPMCIREAPDAEPQPVLGGDVTYRRTALAETVSTSYSFDQSISFAPVGRVQTRVQYEAPSTESPSFVLDGTEADLDAQNRYHSITWCEGASGCSPSRNFDSCTHASSERNLHAVTLDAGEVSFELRIGQSFAGTEPGAFVRAHGTFRGAPFDQRDYFKLVYNPAHHHFERNFAVLFDAPIDGACGIEISGLEPHEDTYVPDVAYTVDCSLERIEELEVESHTLTRGP